MIRTATLLLSLLATPLAAASGPRKTRTTATPRRRRPQS